MLDTQKDSSATISIATLYKRLNHAGLTRSTVRNILLPDWWCDEFEEREGAVFEAAAYIARHTGLAFDRLIDETQELSLTRRGLCFKRIRKTKKRGSVYGEHAESRCSCYPEYQW